MSTIDLENAKQIREPMEVYCGISAEDSTATNTISGLPAAGTIGLMDSNASTSMKYSSWSQTGLADLSGGGFVLDNSLEFPTTPHTATASGKYGIQSKPGEGFSFTVRTSASSISLMTSGSGTVTVNGRDYTLQSYMVVPVPKNTATTLTFTNTDPEARIIVYSSVPGVSLTFTNDNLVSVVLDLAGDLSLEAPTLEASSVEINAYYPDDISEIIAAVEDNTPLWYYAGYDGDYSETRNFYLSEPAAMQDNVITLHGVDATGKLEEKNIRSKVVRTGTEVFNIVKSAITSAGIKIKHLQNAATLSPWSYYGIVEEQSAQDLIGDMMISFHTSPASHWYTYTDAGIPRLYSRLMEAGDTYRQPWQLKVWEIREEDCADVVRTADRKVSAIVNEEEGSPVSYMIQLSDIGEYRILLDSKGEKANHRVEAGEIVTLSSGTPFARGMVTNASRTIYMDATSARVVCKSKGQVNLYGHPLAEYPLVYTDSISPPRPGITLPVRVAVRGYFNGGPLLSTRYRASNITGSFTFKGDPRMQPRDIFKFIRLDGTTEIATIERIGLTHEGGGTTAEIHYRLGVC